jgi:hypothetical protein
MAKKAIQQCAHADEGACPRCAKPFSNGRPWGAQFGLFRKLDQWQYSLLEQYALIAGLGAAPVIPLEV